MQDWADGKGGTIDQFYWCSELFNSWFGVTLQFKNNGHNVPFSGAVGGFFDGHPLVNWRHENLMRLFFRALRAYVQPGGLVKAR